MNIITHVCEVLHNDNLETHFKYIPIKGEIISKMLFDMDNIVRYDPWIPTRQGPPPRPRRWRTYGQPSRIVWRISKQPSGAYNRFDDLEFNARTYHSSPSASRPASEAGIPIDNPYFIGGPGFYEKSHSGHLPEPISSKSSENRGSQDQCKTPPRSRRDRRYDLDYICNTHDSFEYEREKEDSAPLMFRAADAGEYERHSDGYITPQRRALHPQDQPECDGPTRNILSSYHGQPEEAFNRDTSGINSRDYHPRSPAEQIIPGHVNHEYNIRTSEPENICEDSHHYKSQFRGTQDNNVEHGTHGQEKELPLGYCVTISDLSQSHGELPDADAVSSLSDSVQYSPALTNLVYDIPTIDYGRPGDLYKDDALMYGSGCPEDIADDHLAAREGYDAGSRRPPHDRAYKPRTPSRPYTASRYEAYESSGPTLPSRGTFGDQRTRPTQHEVAAHQVNIVTGNVDVRSERGSWSFTGQDEENLQAVRRRHVDCSYEAPRARRIARRIPQRTRDLAAAEGANDTYHASPERYHWEDPSLSPPRQARTWKPLFDRGKKVTTRLFGGGFGRSRDDDLLWEGN